MNILLNPVINNQLVYPNNQNENVLYATALGVPSNNISLKSLGKKNEKSIIKNITLLGSKEKLSWKQYPDSLVIKTPKNIPNSIAVVFNIQQ